MGHTGRYCSVMLRTIIFIALLGIVSAENGSAGWLRYSRLPSSVVHKFDPPTRIVTLNATSSSPVYSAGKELENGFKGLFGKDLTHLSSGCGRSSSIIVGTFDSFTAACGPLPKEVVLEVDGFWLSTEGHSVRIIGQNERGALYGTFEYLSMLARGNFSSVSYVSNPSAPVRWTNEWDNMDGTIERGYGGLSFFFANGSILPDLTRAAEYARLLASVKINGVILTNVNADPATLKPENIKGLGRIGDAMRPYGVQIGIALNFASPQTLGGLPTFDPLDEDVISWWHNVTAEIYGAVPDFGGFLVKANSEGQPGPLTYNRTLAQGANLFADAVKPYGGIVMFRAFVYSLLNISDWRADRASAAYEAFQGLDGAFKDNVIVQIKAGPLDFQVREPASPLFGYLRNTNVAIELPVTQEYLGQQSHTVYLAPLWKSVLDMDLRVDNESSPVSEIVTGRRLKRKLGGFAGVANAGNNVTWMGSHLSMSNLYAYGRLAWNPAEDSETIVRDWSHLTFGLNPKVTDVVTRIHMESWPAYLNYSSGNTGLPTLTDVTNNHFGPNVRAQDDNGYGIWTRSDSFSIGMDRTVRNGTGFSGQYPPELAVKFEHIDTTPTELLLWFHHVNYTHTLPSGQTVIQYMYDTHYSGAEVAQTFPSMWKGLEKGIDQQRFREVLHQLTFQAGHAIAWRDSIVDYYHNLTQIPDEKGRVGKHEWRIEAESMTLNGYKLISPDPPESASNFSLVTTVTNTTRATAKTKLQVQSGLYDIVVVYFDLGGGVAKWEAHLDNRLLGKWQGDNEYTLSHAATQEPDGASKARITFNDVHVKKGDTLEIVGVGDGLDTAPLDYVAVSPRGTMD
ncbi:hypothetical protein ATERTT37_000026 [Aspergillus terreus]